MPFPHSGDAGLHFSVHQAKLAKIHRRHRQTPLVSVPRSPLCPSVLLACVRPCINTKSCLARKIARLRRTGKLLPHSLECTHFYRFIEILRLAALLPFYAQNGSLLPYPHPMVLMQVEVPHELAPRRVAREPERSTREHWCVTTPPLLMKGAVFRRVGVCERKRESGPSLRRG